MIFLTTLIGAGQGLFLGLYAAEIATLLRVAEPQQGSGFFVWGSALALVFTGLGAVASLFHLGHPERAWRALAMWRTSWRSREGIALPVFMAAVGAYGLGTTKISVITCGCCKWELLIAAKTLTLQTLQCSKCRCCSPADCPKSLVGHSLERKTRPSLRLPLLLLTESSKQSVFIVRSLLSLNYTTTTDHKSLDANSNGHRLASLFELRAEVE